MKPNSNKYNSILRTIAALLTLSIILACNALAPGAKPAATEVPAVIVEEPTNIPNTEQPAVATEPVVADAGIVFQDDFSANNNGWETGEEADDYGTVTREFVDGQYVLSATSTQEYFIILNQIPNFVEKDFVISLDVTVLESTATSGDFSIEFSLREADGIAGRHYSFVFYNDATTFGEVWPTGEYESIIPFWENESNSAIQLEPGVKNTIRIEAIGTTFAVYVNDQLVKSVTDETIQDAGEASINMALNQANQSIKIAFDNLVITSLP